MKRIIDVAFSVLALVATSPLWLVIAVIVKIDSRGPVLFRQERVGRRGQSFRIAKFRTMTVANDGPLVTASGDNRVTRAGKWLRAAKADEIPQFLNVIVGEMSLVGPRPEVPAYVAKWSDSDRDTILSVRPGITDPASIKFRGESGVLASQADPEAYYVDVLLPMKAQMYVDYVNHQSVKSDLGILFKTVVAVARPGRD
jgi:lipopolysaccharide/colanic/teichoic acid biosynthesis glycosyltransferase